MLTLVVRPETEPPDFGIPTSVGVPDRYANLLRNTPDDVPYVVVRECWDGLTAYAGPLTQGEVDAIGACSPPPDPDPARTVLGVLASTPIDRTALTTNLDYLSAYLGNAQVQALPQLTSKMTTLIATLTTFYGLASPTAAQTAAATKAEIELTVVVQRVTLHVLADVIRFQLAR